MKPLFLFLGVMLVWWLVMEWREQRAEKAHLDALFHAGERERLESMAKRFFW